MTHYCLVAIVGPRGPSPLGGGGTGVAVISYPVIVIGPNDNGTAATAATGTAATAATGTAATGTTPPGTTAGTDTAGIAPLGTMPGTTALMSLPQVEGGTPASVAVETTPPTAGVASVLANLLPLAGSTLTRQTTGAYVGDGLPPVPPRLASKIRQREFVEMGELLPEFWGAGREETGERREEPRTRR